MGNRTSWLMRLLCAAGLACLPYAIAGCDDDDEETIDDGGAITMGDGGADAGSESESFDDGDPTTVTLEDGELEGDAVGDAVRFLKIPYAKPPIGDLRWRAPEPNEPWDGVRHESDFASPCPQPPSQQSPASDDEDCLYVNVWRPNNEDGGAPVMVWIHGGGFTTGSAGDMVPTTDDHLWYDGRYFAERHGVVVVSMNYRLGGIGFFAHPALAEEEGSPVGNQGLLDQQLALRWVRDNIERFGGDPDNVTIFGESAGAGSVCMHLVSPGSRGLFHRAVGQSGGCTGNRRGSDRETLDEQLEEFASALGCEGDDEEVLECLRDVPASEIVGTEMVNRSEGLDELRTRFSFGAVVDGDGGFLPEPAVDFFERGDVAQVPYLLGTNTEESNLYFLAADVPEDEAGYIAEINETYGDFADRVLEMYPLSEFDGEPRAALSRISSDSGLVCSTLDTARRAVEAGLPVHMYNFNIPWSISPALLGPSHAAEISHVFGSPYDETEEHIEVADAMNAYWASFAESGDPNHDDAPATWPQFMAGGDGEDLRLQLDPGFDVLESFRNEECALWSEYAEQQD